MSDKQQFNEPQLINKELGNQGFLNKTNAKTYLKNGKNKPNEHMWQIVSHAGYITNNYAILLFLTYFFLAGLNSLSIHSHMHTHTQLLHTYTHKQSICFYVYSNLYKLHSAQWTALRNEWVFRLTCDSKLTKLHYSTKNILVKESRGKKERKSM